MLRRPTTPVKGSLDRRVVQIELGLSRWRVISLDRGLEGVDLRLLIVDGLLGREATLGKRSHRARGFLGRQGWLDLAPSSLGLVEGRLKGLGSMRTRDLPLRTRLPSLEGNSTTCPDTCGVIVAVFQAITVPRPICVTLTVCGSTMVVGQERQAPIGDRGASLLVRLWAR